MFFRSGVVKGIVGFLSLEVRSKIRIGDIFLEVISREGEFKV